MGEKTLFTIRDYKPADKPRLLSLHQMNIPAFFTQSELDDLNRYLDEGIEMYFVVEVDNEIIGAGGINFENNHHTGIISWDYFHPSFQGKGIGRSLLRAVVDAGREIGARRLYLETNHQLGPAIHLYEELGFRHVPAQRVHASPYARADVFMELFLE